MCVSECEVTTKDHTHTMHVVKHSFLVREPGKVCIVRHTQRERDCSGNQTVVETYYSTYAHWTYKHTIIIILCVHTLIFVHTSAHYVQEGLPIGR